MFERTDTPRVFALPPGADFGRAFVAGLLARLPAEDPVALARVDIIVNTSRMQRRLSQELSAGGAVLLPKITPITSLADRFPTPGLPGLRPALRRKLELMRLVQALIDRDDSIARHAAPALADSLTALMDEMVSEGVDPAALAGLEVPDASEHWQKSLAFLRIVAGYAGQTDDGLADADARMRLATERLIARWAARAPEHPVIFAGSTGSRATTQMLMAAVARLPQGALVLPGFDFDQTAPVWEALAQASDVEDHPQARFSDLLNRLGLGARDVAIWAATDGPDARRRLVSLALRPAPVTDAWLREGPELGDLRAASETVDLIEAPSPRIEAQAIALRLRAAVEDGVPAALVTPDRTLTRQVTAALRRWGIEPDDSAGRPLSLSPPGRLFRQTALMLGRPVEAAALITLLKHPLVNTGGAGRGDHLRLTHELERHLRRRGLARPTRSDCEAWAEDMGPAAVSWMAWVSGLAEDLAAAGAADLVDLAEQHIATVEALAAGPAPDGESELWKKAAGEEATKAIAELRLAAPSGGRFQPADYASLLGTVLNSYEVRDPILPHPGVMIWGTLEARVQGADLVILAGLNEAVWPEQPAADPWLNRMMRKELALLSPERRIGLSAHDFQQAIAARHVMLSRSIRSDDASTVPSRWLNRIVNLMQGLPGCHGPDALEDMRARGTHWVDLAKGIDRRAAGEAAAVRPAPQPPVTVRPRRLSVTEIRTLIRDPYAIYAKHVLRLSKLAPLDRPPDVALRGTILHRIVERFLRGGVAPDAADAQAVLMEITDDVLARNVPWPETRRLWRARVDAIADGFLSGEAARRRLGTPYPPERKGLWELTGPPFTLRGTADRIDRLEDGSLAIYDYKSGSVPTDNQVDHFDKQLLLEAVMAEDGGFDDVAPARVARVGYIALSPSGGDRDIRLEANAKHDFTTATVRAEFQKLIAAFDQPERGYASRRAIEETRFEGDFDQLARFGEWDDSDDPTGVPVGVKTG